jgi:hypothetical protein
MSNTSLFLFMGPGWTPQKGTPLAVSPNHSFVTAWADKRSAITAGLSVLFYGGTPTGTLTVEVSNAPDHSGGSPGYPQNQGDDALLLAGSSQAVTASAGPFQWQLTALPARWVRVRYVSAQTTAGVSANAYFNAPHESP